MAEVTQLPSVVCANLQTANRHDDFFDIVVETGDFTAVAGKEYGLNKAAGIAVTLPASTPGARISFFNVADVTSNNHVITAATGDLLKGYAFIRDEADAAANDFLYFAPDGSDDLVITLNGGTTGGLIGDRIELIGTPSGWNVRCILSGAGTLATPFS
jgi:hypothetical protein